jgi:hypothetical protein
VTVNMEKICPLSGQPFTVSADDLSFLEKLSPTIGGRTFLLPPPTLSPDERKRRRLAFRNERKLYRRKCDFTGRMIVSAFSPDKPFKVYCHEAYWSDRWNCLEYGREFDFSRPFFPQLNELALAAPHMNLITSPDAEENNCSYVNFSGSSRNCYLTFDSDYNEDCYYTNVLKHSKNCADCSYVVGSELCYECVDCTNCYNLLYSQDCATCSSSSFLNNCIGCSDCFFCCNLVNKRYYIKNKPYSREDYFSLIKNNNLQSHSATTSLTGEFAAFVRQFPKKYCHILKSENCAGDYIVNAKNCHYCYNIGDGEDLRYCDSLYSAKDCMDVSSFGEKIERVYESGTIGLSSYNIWFGFMCVSDSSDLFYCMGTSHAHNCFGCISPRHNDYCILNKQYSREDYERLVPRIIEHMRNTGEWGEYFPTSMSWFGYNETMAQEYFPLTAEQLTGMGFSWSNYEQPVPAASLIPASSLPDRLDDIADSITETAISCETTERPFRMIEQELSLYRKLAVPLPRKHPDERHRERMKKRNPQTLWPRKCAKTGAPILTTYAPDREEAVYCEDAYLNELI